MVDGGPRLAMLEELRRDRPLSLHGVGLSLGNAAEPDRDHLAALKRLVDRFEPALVSEHLAWSRFDGRSFPDLLPLPRTNEVLARLSANIGQVQDALGREILIENPTHYLPLNQHRWSETSFLRELARRSGCKLLIDVNNVAVGANNVGFDAASWLLDIPAKLVGEIHLAGHSHDAAAPCSSTAMTSRSASLSGPFTKTSSVALGPAHADRTGRQCPILRRTASRARPRTGHPRTEGSALLPDLIAFQRQFVAAIDRPATGPLAVYRNTVIHVRSRPWADYPVVEQIVGDEMFEAIAVEFIAPTRRNRRCSPSMETSSPIGFPTHWIADLSYLPDVARVERLHVESLMAADEEPLVAAGNLDLSGLRLKLHPAVRFNWLQTPAMSIWLAHQRPLPSTIEPDWKPEGALFARPSPFDMHTPRIGAAAHRILFRDPARRARRSSLAAAAGSTRMKTARRSSSRSST